MSEGKRASISAKIGAALMAAAVIVSLLFQAAATEDTELERLAKQKRDLRSKFLRDCVRRGYYTRAGCEYEFEMADHESRVVVTLPNGDTKL